MSLLCILQKIYNKSGLGVPPENICGNFPRPYKYNYKFNGQELQEDLGLHMYDMDFRDYDPAIARWVVLDPVVHHSLSPYNAFDNNPVFWADPSGADAVYNWEEHDRGNTGIYSNGQKGSKGNVAWKEALAGNTEEIALKDFFAMLPDNFFSEGNMVLRSNKGKFKSDTKNNEKAKPPFRWRHLFGPDAIYIAGSEDLGIGLGVGFEQGVIIILSGKDSGIYSAQDFGIGLSTATISLSAEAVQLYYSGDTVTKDVFYGNRFEANFGADALGHVGVTGVYAPIKDGNIVWGYGITLGAGLSATVFSGNINYGRTQTTWNSMIQDLVNKK